ncbi:hypothetical protein [Aquirufa antheringensis]|uniref:hypothetical protein n=1 Tax=Aquirufa antheringensis TaxID=2516559 RepID=UPI001032874C|nr:hypothetical protein [Aquirufa antheringensis]TBH71748.1 hypothetical protein EWU21_05490 [Aquirufa antheringensis]
MIDEFIKYYGIPNSQLHNLLQKTSDLTFGLKDENKVVCITSIELGEAKYRNSNNKVVKIFDYDRFISSLDANFQRGRKRCDAVVFTQDKSNFIFNELKSKQSFKQATLKGAVQLKSTLDTVLAVPILNRYIKLFKSKKCCFCNSISISPSQLNASQAFGRLSDLLPNGAKLLHNGINKHGFEFWVFSGNQIIILG